METLIGSLILLGAFFALTAAVGVLRLPDFFCRIHAATKAGAFGATLIILASVLHVGTLQSLIQGILITGFFYLTAPVASHAIGRAAFRRGEKLWEGTQASRYYEQLKTFSNASSTNSNKQVYEHVDSAPSPSVKNSHKKRGKRRR